MLGQFQSKCIKEVKEKQNSPVRPHPFGKSLFNVNKKKLDQIPTMESFFVKNFSIPQPQVPQVGTTAVFWTMSKIFGGFLAVNFIKHL